MVLRVSRERGMVRLVAGPATFLFGGSILAEDFRRPTLSLNNRRKKGPDEDSGMKQQVQSRPPEAHAPPVRHSPHVERFLGRFPAIAALRVRNSA